MTERSSAPSQHVPTWELRLAFAVIGTVLVVHPLWMLLHVGGDRVTTAVDDLFPAAAAVLAVVRTAQRALDTDDRLDRLGWAFLSGACLSFAAGQGLAAIADLVLGTPLSSLSLADALYVIGTSLGITAVLLLGGGTLLSSRVRLLLDGGIVALAVLLVSWLTVMQAVWAAGATTWYGVALGLFSPIGDAVTVAIVVSTLSTARRCNRSLVVVAAGMFCIAFSDSVYAYLVASGAARGASPIDVGWIVGYLLLALASRVDRGPRPARDTGPARWQAALPYVPLAVATLMALAAFAGSRPMDLFTLLLVFGLVLLVLARQLTAVIESQSLAARLATISAEREILIERAPVGICRLDPTQHLLAANLTFRSMLGVSWAEIAGRSLLSLLHPQDRNQVADAYAALENGGSDQLQVEGRLVRKDGSSLWTSQLATVVREPAGQPESFIAIIENVTERRRQGERAATIQRQLLPQSTPEIPGYELTGHCQPASDVAGDFYDWVLRDGSIDLTVADVMGKGIGAGLVMATLRAVLRAAPPGLGPAERVKIASESVVGMDTGLFVTMFHARLDPAAGVLRYVDAGHGYCAIRRRDGSLMPLRQRSLPLAVLDDEVFEEAAVQLGAGDALIIYSDGLVERDDGTIRLADLLYGVESYESAEGIAGHLMDWVAVRPADDVTVLVLRRQPVGARSTRRMVPAGVRSARPE